MADGSSEELKIVVSAVDNASSVLKQVAENTADSSAEISKTTEKAGSSFGTLVGGIVTAEAAYSTLTGLKDTVVGFFEDSIKASIEQEMTMAQVKINVDNAGLSFEELAPKIDAAGKANERLGFDNNDTALSLSKLTLATGNYDDAVKINTLAMDLARAKNMDLNSATVLLQQVMAGNTRVMKQYGITIDGATTSGEALNLLHEKLQGSAEAFANTTGGHLAAMNAQWGRVKEEVGDQFAPVVDTLFQAFEEHLPEITQDLSMIASNIAAVASAVGPMIEAVDGAFKKVRETYNSYADAVGMTANADTKAALEKAALWKETHVQGEETKALTEKVNDAAISFSGIANKIVAADTAVVKHKDAIAKLTDDYNKMSTTGAASLAELADQFTAKMATIDDAIAKTQQNILDLQASYASDQKDKVTSVAQDIVASEMRVADLKAQIAASTSEDQRASLGQQLAAEQANYDSSLSFRQAHADAILAAEARAKETDLQRTIDDYNAREILDQAAYDKKLATLNQELADKQKEAIAETAIYKAKTDQINKILESGNVYFKNLSAERLNTTTAEVQAEIAQFQSLTAAIAASKAASASALATITVPTFPTSTVAHHEAGGFVDAPRGTEVPIIAHGGEEIIPAEQVGSRGGSTINVVINNPIVRGNSDLEAMKVMLDEVMRPLLLNAKLIHI